VNPLSLLGYSWDDKGNLAGPSASSWTLAGLQGASTFAGTLAQIGAIKANGQNAQQAAYMTARDEQLNASQAFVDGSGQVAGLRTALTQALGSRAAIAGASGVDGGQGLVADNARAITANNDTAAGVARANADIIARRHQINSLAAMLQGNQAAQQANDQAAAMRSSGILQAILGGAQTLLSVGTKAAVP
jgi:hypothetical protein